MKTISIIINLFLTLSCFAGSNPHVPFEKIKENCRIDIKVFMKNGKIKKEVKKYQFEKEEKCKNLSEIYKENFSPEYVQKVETEYKWQK